MEGLMERVSRVKMGQLKSLFVGTLIFNQHQPQSKFGCFGCGRVICIQAICWGMCREVPYHTWNLRVNVNELRNTRDTSRRNTDKHMTTLKILSCLKMGYAVSQNPLAYHCFHC